MEKTSYSASAGQIKCAGRFSFLIPDTVKETGRGQSIYLTKVTTLGLPQGGMDAYWAGQLALGGAAVSPFELAPGVKASWSSRNPTFPTELTLEVAKPIADGVLAIKTLADKGKEEIAEDLVKEIIAGFVAKTDRGFCVGAGALTTEESADEEVTLSLGDPSSPGFEIEFKSHTVSQPDTKTNMNVDEEKSITASHGGDLKVLSETTRTAAGLQGREIRIAASLPHEPPLVRFTWHFPGVGGSSTQPSMNIVGSAPADKKAQLESVWDIVLNSLRSVPPAHH